MDRSGTAQRSIQEVTVDLGNVQLAGDLCLPEKTAGLVVFAHGSGSSRHSPRNRYVAGVINDAGLGTLLMDLLTPEEEAIDLRTAHLRFDIPLLSDRVVGAIDWAERQDELKESSIGLFGSSTGAAAALVAAARRSEAVNAVVSRGGRPDLADEYLPQVAAPTLLIVGGRDLPVIGMNEQAKSRLRCTAEMSIVEGATHLFEEPGTLEEVAKLAARWFKRYLT